MILLKFVPEPAPVVNGEKLYSVQWTQDRKEYRPLDFKVRAKNTAMAELKVLFCFIRELKGKTLDFDIENFHKEEEASKAKD